MRYKSYVPKKWHHLTLWIYCMTRILHQCIFSSLMARAYSKMTMPGFMGLRLWQSGSGSMRHHFHTWNDQRRGQTLTLLRVFGMCWRGLYAAVRPSHHQYKISEKTIMQLWTEITCCDTAYAYLSDAMANCAVIEAKGSPMTYKCVWLVNTGLFNLQGDFDLSSVLNWNYFTTS